MISNTEVRGRFADYADPPAIARHERAGLAQINWSHAGAKTLNRESRKKGKRMQKKLSFYHSRVFVGKLFCGDLFDGNN